jgi:hypothetical protein
MPKGGARVQSGPPPDPNALRRDRPSDKAGWTILPASGYQGPLPRWPLLPDITLSTKRDAVLKHAEELADEIAKETNGRRRAALRKDLRETNEILSLLDGKLELQEKLEEQLWNELWRLPQACVWVQQGWLRDVAQYARHKVRAAGLARRRQGGAAVVGPPRLEPGGDAAQPVEGRRGGRRAEG